MRYQKRTRALLPAILLVLSMMTFVHAGTDSSSYGFDVSIVPEEKNPGVFQATFRVTDLGSAKVVIAPRIRFRAGGAAQTSTAQSENGVDFRFSVSVSSDASIAEYSAEALQGTSTISRSQAKISLPR